MMRFIRKLAAGAVALATLGGGAMASDIASTQEWMSYRPKDQPDFDWNYHVLVDYAVKQGKRPRFACYPNYCDQRMVLTDETGSMMVLYNLDWKDTHEEEQEFCFTPSDAGGRSRRCWFSSGRIVDQVLDGDWRVVATITDHYPGSTD
jgi:hypothetical protein